MDHGGVTTEIVTLVGFATAFQVMTIAIVFRQFGSTVTANHSGFKSA
jgi:hypothetical protein